MPHQNTAEHSLAAMTHGQDPRYYTWRCRCGHSGHGEAPARSSKEDIAERAWHDHDASLLAAKEPGQ